MQMFISDDEVCITILKFQKEFLLNRQQRLRLDAWNINGLIAFKELAGVSINYLQFYDNLKTKPIKRDLYNERVKFISILIDLLMNV